MFFFKIKGKEKEKVYSMSIHPQRKTKGKKNHYKEYDEGSVIW